MEPVETRGCLELVALKDHHLHLQGWAASWDPSPVDGWIVRVDSRELTGLDIHAGEDSQDVRSGHPYLAGADRCRFRIRIPLEASDESRVSRSVVTVTPTIGGRTGRTLFGAAASAIPIPPENNLAIVGGGLLVGFEFLALFIDRAGLRPDARILDVGCGVGRLAVPLTLYLSAQGRYDGFDVVASGIEWAQKEIGKRHANFQFRHVDIHNGMYNPAGRLSADTFRFPYDDASVDFVILASVFTHMRGPEVRHYLDEIRRVLMPGGLVLATFFLMDQDVRELIAARRTSLNPCHAVGEGFSADPKVPENVMAFERPTALRWATERGLEIAGVLDGSWCGRTHYVSYQDVVLLRG